MLPLQLIQQYLTFVQGATRCLQHVLFRLMEATKSCSTWQLDVLFVQLPTDNLSLPQSRFSNLFRKGQLSQTHVENTDFARCANYCCMGATRCCMCQGLCLSEWGVSLTDLLPPMSDRRPICIVCVTLRG